MKQIRLLLFIFSLACSSNVTSQTVYTTKTGEKYHKSSCVYLKYSKKAMTLEKAKDLLQTTSKTVSEVAYDVGFNDPSYFSRSFKEEFGHAPSIKPQ